MKQNEKASVFLPLVQFRAVAEKLRATRKLLQGRAVDRNELARLWLQKIGGGTLSTYLRTAIDFGLLDVTDDGKFRLTALAIELSLAQLDSDEWIRIATRSIHSSKACHELLERFGTDVTNKEIVLYFDAQGIAAAFIERFWQVFGNCLEIVKKAEALQPAEVVAVVVETTPKDQLAEMIDERLRHHGLIAA